MFRRTTNHENTRNRRAWLGTMVLGTSAGPITWREGWAYLSFEENPNIHGHNSDISITKSNLLSNARTIKHILPYSLHLSAAY